MTGKKHTDWSTKWCVAIHRDELGEFRWFLHALAVFFEERCIIAGIGERCEFIFNPHQPPTK